MAILPDADGNATEGPGFNVFAVIDGELHTPDRGMLEGVSRMTALDLAHAEGWRCGSGQVPIDRLRAADEIFVNLHRRRHHAGHPGSDDRIYGNGVARAGQPTVGCAASTGNGGRPGGHATPIDGAPIDGAPVGGEGADR